MKKFSNAATRRLRRKGGLRMRTGEYKGPKLPGKSGPKVEMPPKGSMRTGEYKGPKVPGKYEKKVEMPVKPGSMKDGEYKGPKLPGKSGSGDPLTDAVKRRAEASKGKMSVNI